MMHGQTLIKFTNFWIFLPKHWEERNDTKASVRKSQYDAHTIGLKQWP